jgi:hypothetical protein
MISNAPEDMRRSHAGTKILNNPNTGAPRRRVSDNQDRSTRALVWGRRKTKERLYNDPKTEVGKVSALFKKERSEDWKAQEPWYLRHASGGGKT